MPAIRQQKLSRFHLHLGETWHNYAVDGSLNTYGLLHAAYHLACNSASDALWTLLNDEAYRTTQYTKTGQVTAAYDALRQGVATQVERQGLAPKDDGRLIWMVLKAVKFAKDVGQDINNAFRWFFDDAERITETLKRLQELAPEIQFKSGLLLLWAEADRQHDWRNKDAAIAKQIVQWLTDILPVAFKWNAWLSETFLAFWTERVLRIWPDLHLDALLLRTTKPNDFALAMVKRVHVDHEQPLCTAPTIIRLADKLERYKSSINTALIRQLRQITSYFMENKDQRLPDFISQVRGLLGEKLTLDFHLQLLGILVVNAAREGNLETMTDLSSKFWNAEFKSQTLVESLSAVSTNDSKGFEAIISLAIEAASNLNSEISRGRTYASIIKALLSRKKLAEAKRLYPTIPRFYERAPIITEVANTLYEAGKKQEGTDLVISLAEEAIQNKERYFDAFASVLRQLFHFGQAQTATNFAHQIEETEDKAKAFCDLAVCHIKAKEMESASAMWKHALDLNNEFVFYNVLTSMAKHHAEDMAKECIETSLSNKASVVTIDLAWDSVVKGLLARKDFANALHICNEHIVVNEKTKFSILIKKLDAEIANGNVKEAEKTWLQARVVEQSIGLNAWRHSDLTDKLVAICQANAERGQIEQAVSFAAMENEKETYSLALSQIVTVHSQKSNDRAGRALFLTSITNPTVRETDEKILHAMLHFARSKAQQGHNRVAQLICDHCFAKVDSLQNQAIDKILYALIEIQLQIGNEAGAVACAQRVPSPVSTSKAWELIASLLCAAGKSKRVLSMSQETNDHMSRFYFLHKAAVIELQNTNIDSALQLCKAATENIDLLPYARGMAYEFIVKVQMASGDTSSALATTEKISNNWSKARTLAKIAAAQFAKNQDLAEQTWSLAYQSFPQQASQQMRELHLQEIIIQQIRVGAYQTAFHYMAEYKDDIPPEIYTAMAIQQTKEGHLQKATESLGQINKEEKRYGAQLAVIKTLVEQEQLQRSQEMASLIPSGKTRDEAKCAIARSYIGKRQFDSAIKIIETVADTYQRIRIRLHLANALVENQMAGTAAQHYEQCMVDSHQLQWLRTIISDIANGLVSTGMGSKSLAFYAAADAETKEKIVTGWLRNPSATLQNNPFHHLYMTNQPTALIKKILPEYMLQQQHLPSLRTSFLYELFDSSSSFSGIYSFLSKVPLSHYEVIIEHCSGLQWLK